MEVFRRQKPRQAEPQPVAPVTLPRWLAHRGWRSPPPVVAVHNTNPNGYALRHGDWVLIEARTDAVSKVPARYDEANGYLPNSQPGELYDLREDLTQKKTSTRKCRGKSPSSKLYLGK